MYENSLDSDNMYESPLNSDNSDNIYESPVNSDNSNDNLLNYNKEIFENYIFVFNITTDQFELILIKEFEDLFISSNKNQNKNV